MVVGVVTDGGGSGTDSGDVTLTDGRGAKCYA